MNNGFDRKKLKQIRELIVFTAVVCLLLLYRAEVLVALGVLVNILKPFIYGGVIAFVLNIPMNLIEKGLLKKWSGKKADKLKRPISIVLSILLVILILAIVVITITPQIGRTIVELGNKIPKFMDGMTTYLTDLSVQYPQIQGYVAQLQSVKIDWNSLLEYVWKFLRTGMSDMLASTFSVAGSIIGGFMNSFIGFIFALYILSGKETLQNQAKRIMSAYLKPDIENSIIKVLSLLNKNFSNFVSGQCLEAVILGSMFFVSMTVIRLPYAVLVGVLIAFTALIPIVGAFLGCVIGTFLILVNDPIKAIIFLILFFVLQQIEGNLIYPKVVGNKVGLPAIWVLMAVSAGGSLFGVAGMLTFIPLVSTFYLLLRDSVNNRNAKKAQKAEKKKEKSDGGKIRNAAD